MRIDILIDTDTYDLVIRNGDFDMGISDNQEVALICEAVPEDYIQSPLVGFGIRNALNGVFDGLVRRRLLLQLEADNIFPKSVAYNYESGQLKIEL
jgi:hypothetical protein